MKFDLDILGNELKTDENFESKSGLFGGFVISLYKYSIGNVNTPEENMVKIDTDSLPINKRIPTNFTIKETKDDITYYIRFYIGNSVNSIDATLNNPNIFSIDYLDPTSDKLELKTIFWGSSYSNYLRNLLTENEESNYENALRSNTGKFVIGWNSITIELSKDKFKNQFVPILDFTGLIEDTFIKDYEDANSFLDMIINSDTINKKSDLSSKITVLEKLQKPLNNGTEISIHNGKFDTIPKVEIDKDFLYSRYQKLTNRLVKIIE